MPAAPLSDELAKQAADLYRLHGNNASLASRESGINLKTLDSRLKVAAQRGMLLNTPAAMPGFRVSQVTTAPNGAQTIKQSPEHGEVFEMPSTHRLAKLTINRNANGEVIQDWIRAEPNAIDPEAIVAWIKEAFTDFEPAAPAAPAPPVANADLLTLIPLADWHLGMFAWNREVGENWDLKIAERTIGAAMDELMPRTKPSGTAVVLGLGDLFHSDNNENKTARSGNVLQVDGRYQKIIKAGLLMLVRTGDSALRFHEHVIFRVLPGNHDEHAAVAVALGLMAWYRNEPRVTVDVDPSLFWWHRFGVVLLGATHGHTVKLKDMPQIMAHRRAEDWGVTKKRFVHGGHLHHTEKTTTEGGGCITEIHQAPVPQDAWHFGAGFLSGRTVQAITYHRERGEFGRVTEPIIEAAPTA